MKPRNRISSPSSAPLLGAGLVVLGLLVAAGAEAQVEFERRRPAPPEGEIYVENSFGSIRVLGWDRDEVMIRGTLAAGAEDLDLDSDDESTSVYVSVPESWFHTSDDDTTYRTDLEVHVPARGRLYVSSVNATVEVRGMRGKVAVETVNGSVTIEGSPAEAEVETMTGEVVVAAMGAPMAVESISGRVRLTGATDEVDVETVSGDVFVEGSAVSVLDVQSTTGAVEFRGSTTREGEIEIETFSGPVTLTLPRDVRARFELRSFSGEVSSDLAPAGPDPGDRFVPYRRLRFMTGGEEFEIGVRTHDADVAVRVE